MIPPNLSPAQGCLLESDGDFWRQADSELLKSTWCIVPFLSFFGFCKAFQRLTEVLEFLKILLGNRQPFWVFPSDFHAHCETLVFVGCTRPTIVEPILLLKDCAIQEAVTSVHDDCALSNHEQHFSHGSLLFFQGMVSAQLFPTENDFKKSPTCI